VASCRWEDCFKKGFCGKHLLRDILDKESIMETRLEIRKITPQTLRQRMQNSQPLYLIDTLTGDHFERVHLSGADNACVFEVSFIDQVSALVAEKHAEIVLYGASDRSMEAVVAAEKLQREGYAKVFILDGGLEAWLAAGYPLAGASAADPPEAENRLVLENGAYRVNTHDSLIEWAGRNPNTKHDGTLRLIDGHITVKSGHLTGVFEIDMNAIQNNSLAGDESQPVLIDHLKSDDFFLTQLFPKATFVIRNARLRPEAYLGAPNVDVTGELTLKGINASLDFAATVVQSADRTITARAQFDLDRTRWNVIYGSSRFFEHLGMHLVFDHISIDLKVIAEKVS
jgi:polyisoprenoid-binding protein YceI/rhodanese-related sulfurtransferase